MRAVRVTAFGGPEQLVAVSAPEPEAGPGQCVIDVEAIDVLLFEGMLRAGFDAGRMTPELPWIPGNGVIGRVAAVADGVDSAWVGRRVGAHTGNRGGYAERVAVAATEAVAVPDDLPPQTAAALLHDGVTALKLIDVTEVSAGNSVLVLGSSGGLGIALIQLARVRGARVVAVGRGEDKLTRIAALGPHAVIDSAGEDWVGAAWAALGPGGADVIFDNVGAELGEPAFDLIAERGRISTHGAPSGRPTVLDPVRIQERSVTVTGIEAVQMEPPEMATLTERAFALAVAGELEPVVGQTFPLERAADAHAAIESRRVFGKTLLLTHQDESPPTSPDAGPSR